MKTSLFVIFLLLLFSPLSAQTFKVYGNISVKDMEADLEEALILGQPSQILVQANAKGDYELFLPKG